MQWLHSQPCHLWIPGFEFVGLVKQVFRFPLWSVLSFLHSVDSPPAGLGTPSVKHEPLSASSITKSNWVEVWIKQDDRSCAACVSLSWGLVYKFQTHFTSVAQRHGKGEVLRNRTAGRQPFHNVMQQLKVANCYIIHCCPNSHIDLVRWSWIKQHEALCSPGSGASGVLSHFLWLGFGPGALARWAGIA